MAKGAHRTLQRRLTERSASPVARSELLRCRQAALDETLRIVCGLAGALLGFVRLELAGPHLGIEADFIARLAALVLRPRVNLTRYHGVLAPNHRWRAQVTPAGRGRTKRRLAGPERSVIERHAAMTWAQRLKRVFAIDVACCVRCGAALRVIASIEEPVLIERILVHMRAKEGSRAWLGPPPTGPPVRA